MVGRYVDYARRMRKQPTRAEAALWRRLRFKQLGVRFRRQHPIAGFIVDVYCPAARLAVEVDGGGHTDSRQQRYDERRDRALAAADIEVVRVWNDAVVNELDAVVETIAARVSASSAPDRS